ncbi:hypothetical protein [Mesorhizobium sp. Z1-4]|uniref:hypothetical protein n=1 Tax=Mesorhizobium sp. Z1-4 TaxID=2448478 RepID=UPI000FD953D5|nr:hypothetical protein [Mesorhizobium sp. Z1-4]
MTLAVVKFLRAWLLLAVLAIAGGCVSASLEDAVPGARNTGSYPNLNIPPRAETEQLTDEEAADRLAALKTQRAAQKSLPTTANNDVDRLKKLKKSHAQDTLEEIEN